MKLNFFSFLKQNDTQILSLKQLKYIDLLIMLIVGLLSLITYSSLLSNEIVDFNGDNFTYFLLAKAIHQGNGYHDLYSVGMPYHTGFPPGFPYFLSLFIGFLDNIPSLTNVLGMLYIGINILVYITTFQLTHKRYIAIIVALFMLTNPYVLDFVLMFMSEPFFLFGLTLSFWCLINIDFKIKPWKNIFLYVLIIASCYSYWTKSMGIALIVASIVYFLLLKKQYVYGAIYTFFTLLTYSLEVLRLKPYGGDYRLGQYLHVNLLRPELGKVTFTGFIQRILENLKHFFSYDISHFWYMVNFDYENINFIIVFLSLIVIFFAIYGLLNLKSKSLIIFIVLYTSVLLFVIVAYPSVYLGHNRYYMNLIPIVFMLAFSGLFVFIEQKLKKIMWIKNIMIGLCILFCLLLFKTNYAYISETRNPSNIPVQMNDFNNVAKWCEENLNNNAIIANRKPTIFSYYANRISVSYPFSNNDTVVIKSFIENKVTHVLIDRLGYSSTDLYLIPAVNKHLDLFRQIYTQQVAELPTALLAFDVEKAKQKFRLY